MQMYRPQDTVAGWFRSPGSRSPLHNLSAVTSGKSTFLVPVFLSLKGKGNTSYSYMLSATKGHAIIIASIWEEDSGNVIFLIRPQAL